MKLLGSVETAHFPFCPVNHIPFGNGKLAQEGRAFAPKRTSTNFLLPAANRAGGRHHAAVQWSAVGAVCAVEGGEVSLDGAETKSEDCQVDAGTYVASATTTVLIEVMSLNRDRFLAGHSRATVGPPSGHSRATVGPQSGHSRATVALLESTFLESVAGNV